MSQNTGSFLDSCPGACTFEAQAAAVQRRTAPTRGIRLGDLPGPGPSAGGGPESQRRLSAALLKLEIESGFQGGTRRPLRFCDRPFT